MSTATLPVIQSAPVALPAPQAGRIADSELPDEFHETYALRLQGVRVGEIAKRQNICRTQVWRRCQAVQTEFVKHLESTPVFNIIAEECQRLTDLEEKARQLAENTKSDRAKSSFLAEARRAATARQNLLITVGVLPKQPEQIFRVTASMKPEGLENHDGPGAPKRSREQLIADLIDKLANTRCIE